MVGLLYKIMQCRKVRFKQCVEFKYLDISNLESEIHNLLLMLKSGPERDLEIKVQLKDKTNFNFILFTVYLFENCL